MASAWTLGRVGLDVETISGDAPESFKVSGNEIKFSGVVRGASLSDSKSLRTQLLGLVNNPDEPWVPFTFPGDPYAWDSFVRVDDVTVGMIPTSLTGAGWFPFEVELTMLPNAAHAPVIESRVLGALRTNSHGIAVGSTVPWWGVPSDATMDFRGLGAGGVSYVSATRTSDTGGVRIIYTTSGALMYDDAFTWQCAPGDFYDGSAKVELTGDGGTTYRAVTGRQIINLPSIVRLSNGLVRVTYGGGDGLLTVQHYVGSSWITAKTYRMFVTGGATVGAADGSLKTVTILRNSPECTSVRLGWEYETNYESPIYLDLTLRRGALWVDGCISITSGFVSLLDSIGPKYLGVGRDTAEAATAHTSGLHATSADAAGGKYILTTNVAKTNDLTQGAIRTNANATTFPFMIGYEPGSASGPDTFTNQVYAWMAATTETVSIVQR